MRTNFEHCMEMLLEHEGGYVDHPDDPGGETNHGVTRAVYEQHVGRQVMDGEMKSLVQEDVYPIYEEEYWNRAHCDDLPSGVDWAVFDWAVNSGVSRSARALQEIVGAEPDGHIGPMTIQAVHDMLPEDVVVKMHSTRQEFYEGLSTFDTFGRGWSRRNDETLEAALELTE